MRLVAGVVPISKQPLHHQHFEAVAKNVFVVHEREQQQLQKRGETITEWLSECAERMSKLCAWVDGWPRAMNENVINFSVSEWRGLINRASE